MVKRFNTQTQIPVRDKRHALCGTLLAVALLCSSVTQGKEETPKNVTIDIFEYPPFISNKLSNNGLLGEVISEAFRLAGYKVIYNYYPLKRATRYVISGHSLATIGGPFQFPEETHSAIESTTISYIRVPIFYLTGC